jgi:hypothetical protein
MAVENENPATWLRWLAAVCAPSRPNGRQNLAIPLDLIKRRRARDRAARPPTVTDARAPRGVPEPPVGGFAWGFVLPFLFCFVAY